MKFTKQDFNETNELEKLLTKIDSIDTKYVAETSDEIFEQQPFFLSVLLGYHVDTSSEELEEIMKIYFTIWEFFKRRKNLSKRKVLKFDFEKVQTKNIQMLKYTEGESSKSEIQKIYSEDIQNLKSKALVAAIFFQWNENPILSKMKMEQKGAILIGAKSFIECFESL